MKRISRFLLALMMLNTASYADPIITGSIPFTFLPGTVISSSQVNADYQYIINQVNTNAAKNGVNSSITSLLGLTTPIAPAFGGSNVYVATSVGGTVDAITVSATTPAISSFSLVAGNTVVFMATGANTINIPTLNVNGTGALTLNKISNGGAQGLRPGELATGSYIWATYNGNNWVVINALNGFGNTTNVASAANTDLSLAGGRNVLITGTTTITSFGGNAATFEPLYFVKFNGSLTLTHNATSLILPGGANIVTQTNDVAWIEYLGSSNWRVREFIPATGALAVSVSMSEIANSLIIQNNAGTPTTNIDIDATSSILCNTSQYCIKTGVVNLTVNASTTGVNGLDTGALANNTWYYIYIISNGGTPNGLISASATSPTMPAGYVYRYRVGAQRTGGAATFNRIKQTGATAKYTVVIGSVTPNLPIIVSGVSGSPNIPTWTSFSVANFYPPTAAQWLGSLGQSATGGGAIAAPNNNYGDFNSITNPPPTVAPNVVASIPFSYVPESANIFYASNDTDHYLAAHGWVDAVNAN